MYQVIVNGKVYGCSQDKSLLRFLRDDLRLTSVKDGCSEGVCGTLGLLRADQVPDIRPILIEKPGQDMACGAIGIGEITTIPTAPAVAGAYFALDGQMRTSLPLMKTPYERPKVPRYWW